MTRARRRPGLRGTTRNAIASAAVFCKGTLAADFVSSRSKFACLVVRAFASGL